MAAYLPTPRVNLTAICSRRPLGIHLDAASFCFRAYHCATAPCVAMLLRPEWSALAGIFFFPHPAASPAGTWLCGDASQPNSGSRIRSAPRHPFPSRTPIQCATWNRPRTPESPKPQRQPRRPQIFPDGLAPVRRRVVPDHVQWPRVPLPPSLIRQLITAGAFLARRCIITPHGGHRHPHCHPHCHCRRPPPGAAPEDY